MQESTVCDLKSTIFVCGNPDHADGKSVPNPQVALTLCRPVWANDHAALDFLFVCLFCVLVQKWLQLWYKDKQETCNYTKIIPKPGHTLCPGVFGHRLLQGWTTLALEGHFAAELISKPIQKHKNLTMALLQAGAKLFRTVVL